MDNTTSNLEAGSPVLSGSTSSLDQPHIDEKAPHWNGPHDKDNPHNWSEKRKWLVAGISLLGTLLIPLNSTSITVAARMLGEDFNVEDSSTFTNTYWPVSSWTVGGGFLVIMLLPMMEEVGVRRTYLIAYTFFLLMVLAQALVPNFAGLIIVRVFAGGCGTLLPNAIASLIPDLWDSAKQRSHPTRLYILLYLEGYVLGPPIFAGVVERTQNWRWVFWVQLIIYAGLFPLFYFSVKETRPEIILQQRAQKLEGRPRLSMPSLPSRQTRLELLKAMGRPLYLVFTEPVLFVNALWSAFAVGTVFMFTQSVEQVYSGLYNWNSTQCGYVQFAGAIGLLIGYLLILPDIKYYLGTAARNKEMPGQPIPEARLYTSVAGSLIGITGGMFVYAWTSYPSIPWIAPTIGIGMVYAGIFIVVAAVADYITDAYADSGYNGSALAAVCLFENLFSGLLPLSSQSMYTNLGFQWASTLLAFLSLFLGLIPIVIIWKGRYLRERSPYMVSTKKSS